MSVVPDLERKPGGYDFHRGFGFETWVFDIESRERLARYKMDKAAAAVAVSQDAAPLLYASTYSHVGHLRREHGRGDAHPEPPTWRSGASLVMMQPWD